MEMTRKFIFDSAHRVMNHESKCKNIHGHRYILNLTISAEKLDSIGRILDFGEVKNIIGSWIDKHLDHNIILNRKDFALINYVIKDIEHYKPPYIMDSNPTAENLCIHLKKIFAVLLENFTINHVEIFETENCSAKI